MTDVQAKSRAMEKGNNLSARIILADPAKYGSDGLMAEWARLMTWQAIADNLARPELREGDSGK